MQRRLRRVFKDRALLSLLDRIIQSYHTAPGKGLPIGTLMSQYFANLYLDGLDRFVKEELRCRAYVRFMDDFVLWHDQRPRLERWREVIRGCLGRCLALQLKPTARLGSTREGMPFLGLRVFGDVLLPGRRARRRFRGRLRQYETAFVRGELAEADLQRRLGALAAFVEQGRCDRWRRRVLAATGTGEAIRG